MKVAWFIQCRVFPKLNARRKPDALPMFKCAGELDAVNVSISAGTEEKPHRHTDHISEKDMCPISTKVWCISPSKKDSMNISDATAARSRPIIEQLQSVPAWDFKKVKPKPEAVQKAMKDGRSVCNKKYKERVVLQENVEACGSRSFSFANGRSKILGEHDGTPQHGWRSQRRITSSKRRSIWQKLLEYFNWQRKSAHKCG